MTRLSCQSKTAMVSIGPDRASSRYQISIEAISPLACATGNQDTGATLPLAGRKNSSLMSQPDTSGLPVGTRQGN